MKTALLLLVCSGAFCQSLRVDPETHLVTFETVLDVDSMTADELFDRTRAWFVEYFRDSKEVIRGEIKPEMIKGTFIGTYDEGYPKEYESDIVIRFKPGKIKVVINRFVDAKENPVAGARLAMEGWGVKTDGVTLRPSMAKRFDAVHLGCNAMISNLLAYLKKKEDW